MSVNQGSFYVTVIQSEPSVGTLFLCLNLTGILIGSTDPSLATGLTFFYSSFTSSKLKK